MVGCNLQDEGYEGCKTCARLAGLIVSIIVVVNTGLTTTGRHHTHPRHLHGSARSNLTLIRTPRHAETTSRAMTQLVWNLCWECFNGLCKVLCSVCVLTVCSFITSTEEGGHVFTSVCLSVCLFVRRAQKVVNGFWPKFLAGVGLWPSD